MPITSNSVDVAFATLFLANTGVKREGCRLAGTWELSEVPVHRLCPETDRLILWP